MTKKRDRFFAAFGALLFLVTASALTIAVIVNGVSNHNSNSSANQTADQTSKSCTATSVAAAAEANPEVYKPTGAVKTLEKTDLVTGTGKAIKSGDCLQVKYYGTLASNGTVFDENFDKATAFQFQIGQSQVIPGWDQGLIGAKTGGTRRLVIPSALAYGSQSNGTIPANSNLVFTVKILAVK
jgi:FKBP-type peptidyl-prolyl cis-trans isomerase